MVNLFCRLLLLPVADLLCLSIFQLLLILLLMALAALMIVVFSRGSLLHTILTLST